MLTFMFFAFALQSQSQGASVTKEPALQRATVTYCTCIDSPNIWLFRFADILGLELNMIKVFTDEIPRVPISAFTDLDLDPSEYQVHKTIFSALAD